MYISPFARAEVTEHKQVSGGGGVEATVTCDRLTPLILVAIVALSNLAGFKVSLFNHSSVKHTRVKEHRAGGVEHLT